MSTEKCNNICLPSNITEPFVVSECKTQTINGKSLLNATVVEKNSNKVTKKLNNNAPNPENTTHFDCPPWFDLDFVKQDLAVSRSINSISELKKVPNGEKKEEMFSNHDTVYNFDSFNDVIDLEDEESDAYHPIEVPFQDLSEDVQAELRRRMLGQFD